PSSKAEMVTVMGEEVESDRERLGEISGRQDASSRALHAAKDAFQRGGGVNGKTVDRSLLEFRKHMLSHRLENRLDPTIFGDGRVKSNLSINQACTKARAKSMPKFI